MAEKKEKKIIDADTGLEVKAGSKKKPVSSTGAFITPHMPDAASASA